ncbi:MAG TPA: hypothetical protein VG651_04875 [Stellaceae bacterium]|nr:hypothetical protein [Stellaceae bacterium]
MTDGLFPMDEVGAGIEFVGFDPMPAASGGEPASLPVPAAPRRRRAKKLQKRVAVRVWFDQRELVKLNARAVAQGVELPEYLRRRALRDPRSRAVPRRDDLFAQAEITQTTVVRLSARLSPALEERITAYFSPGDRVAAEAPREPPMLSVLPSRANVFAKLAQFLTMLAAPRWPGQRAAPPAGT